MANYRLPTPSVAPSVEDCSYRKRRGIGCCGKARWILLTPYHRMCQRVNTLVEEKCNLEKENTNLRGRMAMLQCQNYILGDQACGYQMGAEKAAVWCAQYKYKKGEVE